MTEADTSLTMTILREIRAEMREQRSLLLQLDASKYRFLTFGLAA